MNKDPREVEVEVLPKDGSTRPPLGQQARTGKAAADDPLIAMVARLMDSQFVIPGTNIRFGLDPILGLLPGLGDTVTGAVSVLLLMKSARYGVPKVVLARMALNVIANTAVGSIPVVGDAFSIWFKSNNKNYELLKRHSGGFERKASTSDWIFVLLVALTVIAILTFLVIGMATLLSILGDWLRAR